MSNRINTILFDLDGTLLSMDSDKFMKIYFYEMGEYFKDLIEAESLIESVWKATNATIMNLEDKTNEEIFMSVFEKLIPGNLEEYKKRFDKFYDEVFIKTKEAVHENLIVKESVKILKNKGYKLVIATNPLFPYKAIVQRIQWTGLNPSDFIYVSHYEKNCYCKPHLNFYKEVLEEINKTPEECLMVGNDVQEDIIAGELGIKTYLIKNNIIHRTKEDIIADYIGDYNDFYRFVDNLPIINKK